MELHGLRKDGREFPVEISLSPLETTEGLLVSAAIRDVTDRKVAEQRMRELAEVVESCQDAVASMTLEGRITFWNAAAQTMYGYTSTQAIGSDIRMLASADEAAEIDQLLGRLAHGQRVEHQETLRVSRDGALLDVDVTLSPVRGHDGAVIGVSAIVRDIRDRKRAERELTRLYEQQRHVALTLQRSLMGNPATIPGVATAYRYLPATQGAGVGGDWFDLIPLGAGRVGVFIGDVMGRGLDAAALMGQLRSAARALAKTQMPPQRLMQILDMFASDLHDQLITCCYLIIQPAPAEESATGCEVTICSAGHLPPLVATGRRVRRLPTPVSVPLGVGEVPHQQATFSLKAGSTLVLYTDGLVETPHTDIDTQIDSLAEQLSEAFSAGLDLDKTVDEVLAALLGDPGGCGDDVTLLLVQPPKPPLATAAMDLPAQPSSVPDGRRFLTAVLRDWGCDSAVDQAALLASEILTNAVRHGQGPLRFRARHDEREVTVEVSDYNPEMPQPRLAEEDDESGRGLGLMEILADAWGSYPTDDGKTVWFSHFARREAGPPHSARLLYVARGVRLTPGRRPRTGRGSSSL